MGRLLDELNKIAGREGMKRHLGAISAPSPLLLRMREAMERASREVTGIDANDETLAQGPEFKNGSEITFMGIDYAATPDMTATVHWELDPKTGKYLPTRMTESTAHSAPGATVSVGVTEPPVTFCRDEPQVGKPGDLFDVRQHEDERGVYRVKRKAAKAVSRGFPDGKYRGLSLPDATRRFYRDQAAGRATQVTMDTPLRWGTKAED